MALAESSGAYPYAAQNAAVSASAGSQSTTSTPGVASPATIARTFASTSASLIAPSLPPPPSICHSPPGRSDGTGRPGHSPSRYRGLVTDLWVEPRVRAASTSRLFALKCVDDRPVADGFGRHRLAIWALSVSNDDLVAHVLDIETVGDPTGPPGHVARRHAAPVEAERRSASWRVTNGRAWAQRSFDHRPQRALVHVAHGPHPSFPTHGSSGMTPGDRRLEPK